MSNMADKYEIATYITNNPVMILGTIDGNGKPQGAAVYGLATSPEQVYFVTKVETQKFRNITVDPNVSITVVNASENSSLQAGGKAEIEKSPQIIEMVMAKMARIYAHSVDWLPPITKLRAGAYQVVGIKLNYARLARFKDEHVGSQNIFKTHH